MRGRERDAVGEQMGRCRAFGCQASVESTQALCGHHWSHLPAAAQESLKESFRRRLEGPAAAREYVSLMEQAAEDATRMASLRGCTCVPGRKKRRSRVIRRVA